jgi:hypothetical protein
MSEGSCRNALITVGGIAAAAAITAGLLVVAGVGDDTRDDRIRRLADDLATGIVRESSSVCDSWIGYVDVSTNWRVLGVAEFSDLPDAERDLFSHRFAEKLSEECVGQAR